MNLPLTVESADQARNLAIRWQCWAANQSMSQGELVEYQAYFHRLAERFDLVEEFEENGIC